MSDVPEVHTPALVARQPDAHPLDALTGGAFSAPTSGERSARIRDWLATEPAAEQLQEVFKELSGRDKGAARPVRERLDDIKRAKGQEAMSAEWAERAQALLTAPRLNMADAMAWQRDAAKAGAPLSREPLSQLKVQLADRVRVIEDLQHRVQVQREAAVLLAQRIEVLSTKPWRDAQAVVDVLNGDIAHWQDQARALADDTNWGSVEAKFPPLLDASRAQLLVVWNAFQGAVAQAAAAAQDAHAPLPTVPVWADELRVARGGVPVAQAEVQAVKPAKVAKPRVDPAVLEKAVHQVQQALAKLQAETEQGHSKASSGAAAALRAVLKDQGKFIEPGLEHQVHTALVAAGELEGWQRWSADQVREDLVAQAEGLLKRPDGQALGGRKMQELLRNLREKWKQSDQGGVPNHGLWKRFDEACNEAYKTVEAWLDKVKSDAAEHRTQRLALIEEVKVWTAEHAASSDLKTVYRGLHQFADRWREAGHIGEKMFAELQPQWQEAFGQAAAPFEAAQKASLDRRHAMIDEARVLGESDMLRIDAVKAVQQRWQAEAQSVPLDRKHEQKLWDAFRKPIDDAFNRKTAEREKVAGAMSEHDRVVLDASRALEAANASGDAQQIRAAMAGLEAALRGQAQARSDAARQDPPQKTTSAAVAPASDASENVANSAGNPAAEAGSSNAAVSAGSADTQDAPATGGHAGTAAEAEHTEKTEQADSSEQAAPAAAAPPPPSAPPKRVVAVRGDDRPGMKKETPAVPGRGGKFGDRKDSRGPGGPGGFGGGPGAGRGASGGRPDDRGPRGDNRFGDRPAYEDRGPRLGDAAFRAQRDALEHAENTLRKLAAQAHGEALTQLLTAWDKRDAAQVPSVQALGGRVPAGMRGAWAQAVAAVPQGDVSQALLRLEMAAEAPTPAEHLDARRALQLHLLTRRNDPTPAQTWGDDAAKVLAGASDATSARRLQNVLKNLLRK